MEGFQSLGRALVVIGGVIVVAGILLMVAEKVNVPFIGKLPGDIFLKRKNFQLYFPIVSSIVLSLILSLILYFVSHFSKR